jgi:hypothetical protein
VSRPALLAWTLVAVSVVIGLIALPFRFVASAAPTFDSGLGALGPYVRLLPNLATLTFPLVGGLIASSRPRNPIGWIFVVILGIGTSLYSLDRGYAVYGLYVATPPAPGAEWAAWWQRWGYLLFEVSVASVMLLFPTGRPPSARWGWLFVVAALGVVLESVGRALRAGVDPNFPGAVNPVGTDAAWVVPALTAGQILDLAFFVAAAASLVIRFLRSTGSERQQLKWVAYAAGLALVVFAPMTFALGASNSVFSIGAQLASAFATTALPAATGAAILRFRLYDVDLLINRTIVYGILSAFLGSTFLVVVLVAQAALRPFTSGSEVAIAGSTLATVALAQPLRGRVQTLVDRRFYRSRYDAAQAADAFAALLRDEVDLESVRRDLLEAVTTTLRPAHAGVWFRERG